MKESSNLRGALKVKPKLSFKFLATYNTFYNLDNEFASSNFHDVSASCNKNNRVDTSKINARKVHVKNKNSRIINLEQQNQILRTNIDKLETSLKKITNETKTQNLGLKDIINLRTRKV